MLSRMPGPVALVGSGEFLPAMADFDAGLLAATGRSRPRVAILPTASWPDGEEVFHRWATHGRRPTSPALGAEVEPVLVRDRVDADDAAHAQAIGEADLDLPLGRQARPPVVDAAAGRRSGGRSCAAHERGAVLAGCSAGAMILAGAALVDLRRRRLFWPLRWRDGPGAGAGRVGRARTTTPCRRRWRRCSSSRRRAAIAVLGIDEETAVVGRDGSWQVHGRGARHGLARPPPRAVPSRATCSASEPRPADTAERPGDSGPGRSVAMGRRERGSGPPRSTAVGQATRQSGLTCRKQSEQ